MKNQIRTNYFIIYKSEGENFTDTTDVKNGSYKFSGKIRDARTAYLIAININKNIESKYKYTIVDRIMLFIEPTKMKATSSNSFSNLNLTGSPSNIDYQKWISASIPSKANMDEKAGVWFALGDTWMKSKSKEDSLRLILLLLCKFLLIYLLSLYKVLCRELLIKLMKFLIKLH